MGVLSMNIVGTHTRKTLRVYSNTESLELMTATWNIGDDIYSVAPLSDTNWTSFKNNYITDYSGDNSINVNFEQVAFDNGTITGGSPHSFDVSCYGNNTQCQSGSRDITLSVAVTYTLDAPLNFAYTIDSAASEVLFTWDAVTGADTYTLGYRITGTSTYTYITASASTNGTLTGLVDGNYDFIVYASDSNINSSGTVLSNQPIMFTVTHPFDLLWVLDDSNPTFEEVSGGNALTPVGDQNDVNEAIVLNSESALLPTGVTGFLTPVDASNNNQTLIVVVKRTDLTTRKPIVISTTDETTANGGMYVYFNGNNTVRQQFRKTAGPIVADIGSTHQDWAMIATSVSTSPNTQIAYHKKSSMASATTATSAATMITPIAGRKASFGNAYYVNSVLYSEMRIAACAVVNSDVSIATMDTYVTYFNTLLSSKSITL